MRVCYALRRMPMEIDYRSPGIAPKRWPRVLRVLGWTIGGLIATFVGLIAIVLTASMFPPALPSVFKQCGLVAIPSSFVLGRSRANPGFETSAYYQGTLSAKDAADFVAQLSAGGKFYDASKDAAGLIPELAADCPVGEVMTSAGSMPNWSNAASWGDRRTFVLQRNYLLIIHISPGTGAIEIQYERD